MSAEVRISNSGINTTLEQWVIDKASLTLTMRLSDGSELVFDMAAVKQLHQATHKVLAAEQRREDEIEDYAHDLNNWFKKAGISAPRAWWPVCGGAS